MNVEINTTKDSVRIIATLIAFYVCISQRVVDPASSAVNYANKLVKELERK